ncbi:variant erythrocyte surface antigen-1 family protein [Babesia caballi]|uniref:Variant erythrocyte surface antigen-1 family protein n=1 Tax=Babesia caballi TaxID=5871 RepID=A0AAV4LNH4_BABCB|nr:variant erythrocyte surface antigen-1 family protein [Babesia caballi]
MSAGKSLTEPPQNLKEAVDWVLCMSGNDGEGDYNKGQEAIKKLATQVKTLLSGVSVPGVTVGLEQLFQGDTIGSFGSNASIASLASGLNALIDQTNGMGNRYAYTYKKDDSSQTVNDEKSAKMFLGMIPLLFFGLGFLFYMCRRDGGKWSVTKLSAGPFRVFLDAVGFNIDQLNGGKNRL